MRRILVSVASESVIGYFSYFRFAFASSSFVQSRSSSWLIVSSSSFGAEYSSALKYLLSWLDIVTSV